MTQRNKLAIYSPMASPSEKLAQSLEILHGLQNANGAAAIRAKDMTRTHRERLLANGFLQEVIKGWYIPSRPDEVKGESTAWYASFWRFAAVYLETRFGKNWSPVAGAVAVPARRQLDGPPAACREVLQSPQQSHHAPARNIPAGSARRASRRQTGRKKKACGFSRSNRR